MRYSLLSTLILAAFVIGDGFPAASASATRVAPVSYASAGAGQFAVSISSVTKLTVPAPSYLAQICVEGAAARYTDDAVTTPTASVGMPVASGQCFAYSGPLSDFQIIGAGATIDVSYYK